MASTVAGLEGVVVIRAVTISWGWGWGNALDRGCSSRFCHARVSTPQGYKGLDGVVHLEYPRFICIEWAHAKMLFQPSIFFLFFLRW